MVGSDSARQQTFKTLQHADNHGAPLFLKTQLLNAVTAELEKTNWTHEQAAQKLGVKRQRVTELCGRKIDKFSVELLVKYLSRLGKEVSFDVRSARP